MILERLRALMHGVTFSIGKEWYNFMAYIKKDEYEKYKHIICFDEKEEYIPCPDVGGVVEVYLPKKGLFRYKITGFRNESPLRDWLYPSDIINVNLRFVRKVK